MITDNKESAPIAENKFINLNPLIEYNTWISYDYCSNWDLHSSIREILQNQLDGITMKIGKKNITIETKGNNYEFQFKNKNTNEIVGEINYDINNEILTIWNIGNLETGDLLLGGKKGKENNCEIIGRFGEGMKIAALIFQKLEKVFMIFTNNEEWRFKLKKDEKFKKNNEDQICLFWWKEKIKDNKKIEEYKNKIVIKIRFITINEWLNEIDNYLWLTQKNIGAITSIDNNNNIIGQILFGEIFRKKIFVKDIFVQLTQPSSITDSYFGFNTDVTLDRDRNCVPNLNERNEQTSKIIANILNKKKKLYNETKEEIHNYLDNFERELLPLLSQNYGITYYLHKYIIKEGADLLWKEWEKKEENKGKQPVIIDRENSVKKFISDKQLPTDFYPYTTKISWETYYCLCKSSYYKSIENKFNKVVKNSVVENIPENFKNAILDIVNKINVVVNGFNINNMVFKNYGVNVNKEFCFIDNGIIYFSSSLFKDNLDLKFKSFIFSKCLQFKNVSYQKIIEGFGLIK